MLASLSKSRLFMNENWRLVKSLPRLMHAIVSMQKCLMPYGGIESRVKHAEISWLKLAAIRRSYAKKASKLKTTKWKSSSVNAVSQDVFDLSKVESQMISTEKQFEDFSSKHSMTNITPSLLDKIKVQLSDGTASLLFQVAEVSLKGQQFTIKVMLTEQKDVTKSIMDSINEAKLGLVPSLDGEHIKIDLPRQTQDYRDSLSKKIKSEGDAAKVILRKWRRNGMDEIKKKKNEISEDTKRTIEGHIDSMTEHYSLQINEIVEKRTKELKSSQRR